MVAGIVAVVCDLIMLIVVVRAHVIIVAVFEVK